MSNYLQVEGLSKRFGQVKALDNAELECSSGEIHALLGANGSGKSTLIKSLAGIVVPDQGDIYLRGEKVSIGSPQESLAAGIATVHQDFSLVPQLTVKENLFLGAEPLRKLGFIDFGEIKKKADRLFNSFQVEIPLGAKIADLSVSQRQLVEIVKAFSRDPDLLLLDEPTASLPSERVKILFDTIRELANREMAVVFVSHRYGEVQDLCEKATILRNGYSVGEVQVAETSKDKVVSMMLGEEATKKNYGDSEKQSSKAKSEAKSSLSFRAENVTAAAGNVEKVSFSISPGEVLGVGGLQGQGQETLLRALYGLEPTIEGTCTLGKETLHIRSPREAIRNGIVYISGDRDEGLLHSRTIRENISIANNANRPLWELIDVDQERQLAKKVIEKLDAVYESLEDPAWQLSGGNRQKLLIGRWLIKDPKLILMNDPTKGVDVQTKEKIYDLLYSLANDGVLILLFSSETKELISLADNLLVMYEGKVVEKLEGENITEEMVLSASLNTGNNKND
ncbi:sugar ABC transporter ATP-binding protein [Candidatus Bipolaricaulota bacterium]|nr:sugar ABC transporter ATP-binding protein [Candidatus Bipolaricaulota bacterium]